MASPYDALRSALVRGEALRKHTLVQMDFASGTRRVWDGFGILDAGGEEWSGLGKLGSVSEIEEPIGGTAPQVTFTLSGVDPRGIRSALGDPRDYKGRAVSVSEVYFGLDLQPIGEPITRFLGTMDVLSLKADGPDTRVLTLTAEGPFTRRGSPPWGYLSDRDQQRLYPGDLGLTEMPAMVQRTVEWLGERS